MSVVSVSAISIHAVSVAALYATNHESMFSLPFHVTTALLSVMPETASPVGGKQVMQFTSKAKPLLLVLRSDMKRRVRGPLEEMVRGNVWLEPV